MRPIDHEPRFRRDRKNHEFFSQSPKFVLVGTSFSLIRSSEHPLFGIPDQDRPGDVHPVSGKPLVPASSHAVMGLEMGNHRLDSRQGGDQPLEPSGVFQRSPVFSLLGNGHLRDPGQCQGRRPGPGSVSPIRRKFLRQGAGRLFPSGNGVFQRRGVVPVVGVLGMGHHHPAFIDGQEDLDPVLVRLARFVLGDAGDLRLMSALHAPGRGDLPKLVFCLGDDPGEHLTLLPEPLPEADQGPSDRRLCPNRGTSKSRFFDRICG